MINKLLKHIVLPAVLSVATLTAGASVYDVNGDGAVDIDDTNAVINTILGRASWGAADVNGDGRVNVQDLNKVINAMLGHNITRTFTVNGVSFTMVAVAGGTFTMGATAEQGSDAWDEEKPAHQVTLDGFSIGATEVTQELWVAVLGSNPSWFNGYGNSDYGTYHSGYNYGTNLQRPVECVGWDDCQTFISKLNALTGENFRLPTEAEWEYAARGGSKSQGYKYSGSNTLGDVAWYWDNIPSQSRGTSGYGTQSVATKAPNELGLYDMSGNVWEWCQDWWGIYSSAAQRNPMGPTSGLGRVGRGGGWSGWGSIARYCRVSSRYSLLPSNRHDYLGLRLALGRLLE